MNKTTICTRDLLHYAPRPHAAILRYLLKTRHPEDKKDFKIVQTVYALELAWETETVKDAIEILCSLEVIRKTNADTRKNQEPYLYEWVGGEHDR